MRMNLISRFSGAHNRGINPKGFHVSQIKFYIVLLPIAVFMLLPMVFIFSNAFKPADELFAFPPRFFVISPTITNFVELFSKMSNSGIPVSRYLFNSVLITLVPILPGLAIPVGLFLIKQFIDGIPDEVVEAAQVDGAPDLLIYWKIILP